MKKLTLLALLFPLVCASQEVATLSTMGRQEYGYLTTTYYNYSPQGQLKTIEKVEEDYTSDISLEYAPKGDILIKSCEYGLSEEVFILKFNAKNYISKVILEAGEFTESEYTTFEYNADDQLVKAVKYSSLGKEISRKDYVWQDGNLVEVKGSEKITISYSSLENKPVNYDILYSTVLEPKLGALCPSHYFGKMSKNLPEQIKQGDETINLSYILDSKGYIDVATLKYATREIKYIYKYFFQRK